MAETDTDLRAYTLTLVSHKLLTPATPDARLLTQSIVAWSHTHGHGIYQLPIADYQLPRLSAASGGVPGIGADTEPDADASQLDFVMSQLEVYLAADYQTAGLILRREDLRAAAGRRWFAQLRAVADARGVSLTPLWLVPRGSRQFSPVRHLWRQNLGQLATARIATAGTSTVPDRAGQTARASA